MTESPPEQRAPEVVEFRPSAADDSADPAPGIPVLRPRLPTADQLVPYLRRLDASRTYTNHGVLVVELEHRLAGHFEQARGTVVTASSGLSALIGAILATAGRADRAKPLALIPGYTFVATAAAAEQCGFEPALVDVDPDSWLLDARSLHAHPRIGEVGLVIPVATYGRPVPQAPWREFQRATGIPVAIDGAASFDTVTREPDAYIGEIPLALSFHATKSFGTGEGGCVLCSDQDISIHVARALNFGFHGDRNCRSPNTNGKMSEYHAAVGLAELDGWQDKRAAMHSVADRYRSALARTGIDRYFYGAPVTGANYALFDCADAARSSCVQRALAEKRIDFRFWYGGGLHRQEHYSRVTKQALGVTENLAQRLLGLPFAPDLTIEQLRRIADAVADGLSRS